MSGFQDSQNQKVSELMDGDLKHHLGADNLSKLLSEESSLTKWEHYHLIRDILQEDGPVDFDIAANVRRRIEAEPIVIAPKAVRKKPKVLSFKPVVPFAMAASLAIAAVAGLLLVNSPDEQAAPGFPEVAVQEQTAPAASVAEPKAILVRVAPYAGDTMPQQMAPRVNQYLFNHAQYAPAPNAGVRLVGFGNNQ